MAVGKKYAHVGACLCAVYVWKGSMCSQTLVVIGAFVARFVDRIHSACVPNVCVCVCVLFCMRYANVCISAWVDRWQPCLEVMNKITCLSAQKGQKQARVSLSGRDQNNKAHGTIWWILEVEGILLRGLHVGSCDISRTPINKNKDKKHQKHQQYAEVAARLQMPTTNFCQIICSAWLIRWSV